METIKLDSQTRSEDKQNLAKLRLEKLIPAVLYGRGVKNVHLTVNDKIFHKIYGETGSSTLLDLSIDGKDSRKVLVQDIQYHPATDEILHIDFFQVKMDEKIEAEVGLEFTGTSSAVKDEGGVLVKNIDSIEVSCLPADLPSKITVDISVLATFDDVIKIKDLDVSDKVEIMQDSDRVITTVTPPRTEEELAELDEEVEEDVESVEGVKEEEPEEGEESKEGAEGKEDETADKVVSEGEVPAPAEGKPVESKE